MRLNVIYNEHKNRSAQFPLLNCIETWFIHCCHPQAIMLLAKSIEIDWNWHQSDMISEIEEEIIRASEQVSYITYVCHRGTQTHHPDFLFCFGGYQIYPTHYHFNNRPTVLTQKMNLIKNDQADSLGECPVVSISAYLVPFLRGSD